MKIETIILIIKILTPVVTGAIAWVIYKKHYNRKVNDNKQ
jgi:hypothetical protein